ncbi:MAG: efflux RND transporter periplasmic adaptor subunit [bacterium]|nr:efflux RND transporter periplasmic adaptor subunit [bacterium]
MKKIAAFAAIAVLLGVVVWGVFRPAGPPEIPFAKVSRRTLASNIQTNGKVQPLEWAPVRAGRAGAVAKVFVEKGQEVVRGTRIAELATDGARDDLAAAEARISEAKAQLDTLDRGGRDSELAAIDSSLKAARWELESAKIEADALERLVEKQAATRLESERAGARLRKAENEVAALDFKRKTIVSPVDRKEAEARLREAESDAARARTRIVYGVAQAPIDGMVYNLVARAGLYVQTGDLLAEIGQLDRLRATIFVDEPELGRVTEQMPVVITWDALPGREWSGTIEQLPTRIVQLGTRQVGEVLGVIDNSGRELPASANINARIQARVSENALTIPKEALLREGEQIGVYVLEEDHVVWREIQLGASSITRAEVLRGLDDEGAVALPTEAALSDGQRVSPVFP